MPDSLGDFLSSLSQCDAGLKVFGAATHHYRSHPVRPDEVTLVEVELGVPLPAAYRRFLLEVGHGAGPYYGVWSPAESVDWMRGLTQEYEAECGVSVRPSGPFPLAADDLRGILDRSESGHPRPPADHNWPCDGCLPICHHGCTFWSALVLTGEFAGRVWDVACFGGYDGEWVPANRPPGWWQFGMPPPQDLPRLSCPPTFEEWFAGWVERGLTDLLP